MTYLEFFTNLQSYAEPSFAQFQRKLIFTERTILGVRTPILRKLAKESVTTFEQLWNYPNDCYEVVFIKLTVVSMLPYETFLTYLDASVALIDNWALCDMFKAQCIRKHKNAFLPILEKLFVTGKEYFVRYVLVTLLSFYVEEEYLSVIEWYLRRADMPPYYVHMAAAWLTAEILIKHYSFGVKLLTDKVLCAKTHNKAIQKARESYRLTTEQKEFLYSLKIKK